MLLIARYYSFALVLTISSLILCGFAVPVATGTERPIAAATSASTQTISSYRNLAREETPVLTLPLGLNPNPKVLALGKLLSDKCNNLAKIFPKECKLKLPMDRKLSLQKEVNSKEEAMVSGPATHGQLGDQIGKGGFGAVFDIIGHWSTIPDKRVVVKWFKFKNEGIIELLNLLSINEALDYGVDSHNELHSLWAIMLWKKGDDLSTLRSYRTAISPHTDKDVCKAYMKKVRQAIVEASKAYFGLPGAPMHGDLHRGNVLFWEETKGTQAMLYANLIDWGNIEWSTEDDDDTDEDLLEFLADELMDQLEEGIDYEAETGESKPAHYDFSDENNCF